MGKYARKSEDKVAWLANRVRFGVIYKESEAKLKGKVCKTVLRPAMMTLFLARIWV